MSIIPISIPTKKLAQSITSAASSFTVNNIEGWDGADLETADLGTQHFVVFRNSTGTLIEIMEIDPATIASASITILKRGLMFDGTETEVSANKLDWPAYETTINFGTDVPQLLNNFVDKGRAQTITGVKTFTAVPASSAAPVSGNDLVNKTYADSLSIGVTKVDQLVVAATAGETVSAGNLVYFDLTDNEWKKCDADTAALVENVMLGIAQGSGTNGNAISGGVLVRGVDTNQSGMTQGDLMYASNTAGGISSSTGTTERVIGIARSATNLFFDPEFYYTTTASQKASYPSTGEKAAMAGSSGTPSTNNKYITQDNVNAAEVDQSQTTQNATVEVGEANATTKKNLIGQSFVAATTKIRGIKLYKSANTGSFTGTVTVSIQADSAGSPSGSDLASQTITNAVWLLMPVGEFMVSFTELSLTYGSTYWIVVTTSTSDNSNHPNLGTNSAGGYGSGSVKYKNVTDGWVAISTIDLYFKTVIATIDKIPETDSTTGLLPAHVLPYSFVELNQADGSEVASSTTVTTVYSKLFESGFFKATSGIKLTGYFTGGFTGTASQILTIKLNGTTILTETVSNLSGENLGGNIDVTARYVVYIINSTISSQKITILHSNVTNLRVNSAETAVASYQKTTDATSAVDLSGPVFLDVALNNSVSAPTNKFTHGGIIVEKIG